MNKYSVKPLLKTNEPLLKPSFVTSFNFFQTTAKIKLGVHYCVVPVHREEDCLYRRTKKRKTPE